MGNCCCPCASDAYAVKFDPNAAQWEWENYQARLAAHEVEQAQAAEEKRMFESQGASVVGAAVFPVLGIGLSMLFTWTCVQHSPLPFQGQDSEWARQWLLVAIADYYTCALCLVFIILASEDLVWAGIWSVSILLLGAPFACAYLVSRVCTHSTLSLLSGFRSLRITTNTDSGTIVGYASGFYIMTGLALVLRLSWTIWLYPLYPFQDDPEWLNEWLFTTIGDYSVAALCLCGIIMATEPAGLNLFWSAAVILFSGAGACAYMTYRACGGGSITLSNGQIADARALSDSRGPLAVLAPKGPRPHSPARE